MCTPKLRLQIQIQNVVCVFPFVASVDDIEPSSERIEAEFADKFRATSRNRPGSAGRYWDGVAILEAEREYQRQKEAMTAY